MSKSRTLLLDTHALLWWVGNDSRISASVLQRIESAEKLVVSASSFWEIAMLVQKKRIVLDREFDEWSYAVTSQLEVQSIDVDSKVAGCAGQLTDFHGDPADRLLYATALLHDCTLLSKDRKIQEYQGNVEVVW